MKIYKVKLPAAQAPDDPAEMQALAVGLSRVDAVLLTHAHVDHIAGLDDLRPLNFAQKAAIPLYGTQPTLKFVRKHFDYAFSEGSEGSWLSPPG